VIERVFVWFAWVLMIFCMIAWPYSQFTNKTEPPQVLALSWGALLLTAVGIVVSAHIKREQKEQIEKDEDSSLD
jgi:nitric oxide reductase large subunit